MSTHATTALITSVSSLGISAIIGYLAFKLIKPKNKPSNPTEYGRLFAAGASFICILALLPLFIIRQNTGALSGLVVSLAIWPALSYVVGYVYGKTKEPSLRLATEISSGVKELIKEPLADSNQIITEEPALKFLMIISSVMLLIAALPLPIEYYTPLRFVVCGTSAYAALCYLKKDQIGVFISFLLMAALWNPLMPVYLDKAMWVVLDIAAAIFIFFQSRRIT